MSTLRGCSVSPFIFPFKRLPQFLEETREIADLLFIFWYITSQLWRNDRLDNILAELDDET
ncbi:hypothetical protein [Nostoc sp.]|uniref:hypothetical protein n=1 Tax=Nostoc sp. TaxID=1180 RepID=UPI002FF380A0